ncbi:hypothetical protein E2C01_074241 [Portunus trituberculatus]|uniref:Uncharacterized protein n=1 Tax=Portunus trituberculatus TaxID=210409 RepID=A0A5B7I571_PORTR|nr:hypothetical protein [Portunus trituberculatus]
MARGRRQTRGDQRNLPTQPSPALPPESIQPSLVPFPTHPAKPSITSPPYPSAQPSTLPHPLSPAQYPKSPLPIQCNLAHCNTRKVPNASISFHHHATFEEGNN